MSIKILFSQGFNRVSFLKGRKLFLPILFSLLLGLFLGLFVLFLFPNLGDEGPKGIPAIGQQKEEPKGEGSPGNLINYKTDSQKSYLLQGGVFSNYENADQWMTSFQKLDFHPILWERDSHYYLFLGIAANKEQAELMREDALERDLDVFVKDWLVDPVEILAYEGEIEWINSFQAHWEQTLKDHGEFANWDSLIKEGKDLSSIKDFSHRIEKLLEENDYRNPWQAYYILLEVWKDYEKVIKNLKDRNI